MYTFDNHIYIFYYLRFQLEKEYRYYIYNSLIKIIINHIHMYLNKKKICIKIY